LIEIDLEDFKSNVQDGPKLFNKLLMDKYGKMKKLQESDKPINFSRWVKLMSKISKVIHKTALNYYLDVLI